MKTKLLILMSVLLFGTGLLIGCKDAIETSFTEKRVEPQYDPGPIATVGKGADEEGGSRPGGGGGGGGGTPPNIIVEANFDIKLRALPPCVKGPVLDILAHMGQIDPILKTLLQKFQNNGGTLNYVIRSTTTQGMISQGLKDAPAVTRKASDGTGWVTDLNRDYLENSSEQFIASVLLHEIYHIKSEQDGNIDYQSHIHYFTSNYLDNIKSAFTNYYGLNERTAKALALNGASGGGDPVQKYNLTISDINSECLPYSNGDKGNTKCVN